MGAFVELDLGDVELLAFWRQFNDVWCSAADRLALVRRIADLRLHRPRGWSPGAVRQESVRRHWRWTHHPHCQICRSWDRPLVWHHLIQIQHGGTNVPLNRVMICVRCHADVHPWLPPVGDDDYIAGLKHIRVVLRELANR